MSAKMMSASIQVSVPLASLALLRETKMAGPLDPAIVEKYPLVVPLSKRRLFL
jgi:hypothetical protein